MNYDWNFSRILPYWYAFISGTALTLYLTMMVAIIGTILGVIIGILLKNRIVRYILYPFIDVIRALPPLVLILFMYYLLTEQVLGTTVQALWVYVIAMSINLAAFTADVVRAAVSNMPLSTIEAGMALGMSKRQLTRHIVLPHVLREIIPAMTILYIGMLKMSSLASVINVRELVYAAQTVITNIARSLEAWAIVALIYIALVIPATYTARWVEKWARRGQSSTDRI